ncbi:MAG: S8 family serine peptidase [Candidatus Bathyarchaeota archaeon]|nr:S8 family serine peptidase [Candidatus Bathyarchaeota archaeon]MDH5787173.1 S8 family serine peptidase [Candidatus Bathyarchaeota archaeon]
MKENNVKKEFATTIVVFLLLMSIFSMLNVCGINASQQIVPEQISQETSQEKISQCLKEQIDQDSGSLNQPFRILIKYNSNMKLALPKELKILNEFNIIPLISALASPFEIEELAKLDSVEFIYPDMKVYALDSDSELSFKLSNPKISDLQNVPLATDPIPQTPWFGEYPCFLNESTALIKANELWADELTGEGAIIAILDTGINKYHPDLDDLDDDPITCDPKILAEQVFIEEPLWEVGDPMDYHGHGTHCASTAAGTGGTGAMGYLGTFFVSELFNGTILPGTERGVAPGAHLYNVKVLNNEGWGYDSWIIAGIEWAMNNGVDVMSMSLGGWPITSPEEDPLALALDVAVDHGVVCVVAAGNSGWGYFSLDSPGFDPRVITVGASTETDELAFFSSRGPEQYELHAKPDILAPGTCIIAAFAGFDSVEDTYGLQVLYWDSSGTSMATPHVAGAAALLLQAFLGASPYSVKSAMMLGADDLGFDPMAQGAGRLNLAGTYELMKAAPKESRSLKAPTDAVTATPPTIKTMLNLTDLSILVESSFCNSWKMSSFINMLSMAGATVAYGTAPYSNNSLVEAGTGKPRYDIFILPEPALFLETALPPNLLGYYVQQNGTVLFTGDRPTICTEYTNWTKQWGISWDNKAVGGLSSNIAPHAITDGVNEIYFGGPVASLILDALTDPSPECVAWDPVFPGVVVWETKAPSTGKVVVLSDDGILMDQYLHAADNLKLGFNIVKWFTDPPDMYLTGVKTSLVPPVESPHPYPEDADLLYSVFAPGADWISVHFDTIDVESGYDYITIYDQFMNPVEYYSGYYEDVWTTPVLGDALWIRLQSDFIISYWGFLADAYVSGKVSDALMAHEIGVGATWDRYVVANSTFTIDVDVQNSGNYTEDVMLSLTLTNSTGGLLLNNWNFENVTVAPRETTSVEVTPDAILEATTTCNLAGIQSHYFVVLGSIYNSSSGSSPYPEISLLNNLVEGEISAVPKIPRTGLNPLLNVITPMKMTSNSAPLIAMYPKDFALHNITAFVSGGSLNNSRLQITGNVTQIAGFINATEFTYHALLNTPYGMLPDPSPAYLIPNMTVTRSDTVDFGDVEAPTALFAEFQVYIAEGTSPGVYTGSIELVNGTTVLASSTLGFEVKDSEYRVLWEDYYNDNENEWQDCERLWGGSNWGLGVFEWWKLASQAGFDVDSLHQQSYLKLHVGLLGSDTLDPLGVITYGGYDALYMHDCDFGFRPSEISVLRQLYETGKMDFVVLFDSGSEYLVDFTSYYGIDVSIPILDLLIDNFDGTHPIFNEVDNFTLYGGPTLEIGAPIAGSVTKGIAAGSDDFGVYYEGSFVVAVNEMHATAHLTSRMIVVSDSETFESLEYKDLMFWLYSWLNTGEGTVAKVETDKFAVNMLQWLDTQFVNESPVIDYFDVTPATTKLGGTITADVVALDPEGDSFNVTIAVRKPDDSWNNATVVPVGGHWLRSLTADLEGVYKVYVIATDSYGGTTEMLGGTVETVNMPPEIVSASASPSQVVQGETVFITVHAKDAEDEIPASIRVTVTPPSGSPYNYDFVNRIFATVNFNTSSVSAGIYTVSVTVQDSDSAQTIGDIGSFEVKAQNAPKIVSYSISPDTATVGDVVFIAASCEDAEDGVPVNVTMRITAPDGATTTETFTNVGFASFVFNTENKPEGVYLVTVRLEDSNGESTTADIGHFEVKPVPSAEFPYREATFGIITMGLIILAIAVLLLFMRLSEKPKPVPA